jgi:hypothetical protein
MHSPSLFIFSSSEERDVAAAIGRLLNNDARIKFWDEGFHPGSGGFTETLLAQVEDMDFALFLLTPKDALHNIVGPGRRIRGNVLFELGLCIGRIGRNRTFVLASASTAHDLLPDLAGLTIISYSESRANRNLAVELDPACSLIRAAIQSEKHLRDYKTDFYSCFISYSVADKPFAERLHSDLTDVGVRCWLDGKDIPTGSEWRNEITRAITGHDKMLLVLSRDSLKSNWVSKEVELALRKEESVKRTVLFPVRLDSSVLDPKSPALANLLDRQITDFEQWRDDRAYRKSFSRLVKDLTIRAAVEG